MALPQRIHAQALRHSIQAHNGRARNNTQATCERDYQLLDEGVRDASRGAVELGLAQALASARQTVAMRLFDQVDGDNDTEAGAELVAKEAAVDIEVARRIVAGRLRTPVASCADFLNSGRSAAGMPCAVSFLLCFACRNAVATGRDRPRIASLHQALQSLRSAVTPAVGRGRGYSPRTDRRLLGHPHHHRQQAPPRHRGERAGPGVDSRDGGAEAQPVTTPSADRTRAGHGR
ncbi:hypothetical protein ABZ722_19060 [Streptomyces longwoodensis]|uniref:hypothetical protein n=1 Tax=Streptomyces longwoodensis TaxID=68231 RepID=UPI0033DACF83